MDWETEIRSGYTLDLTDRFYGLFDQPDRLAKAMAEIRALGGLSPTQVAVQTTLLGIGAACLSRETRGVREALKGDTSEESYWLRRVWDWEGFNTEDLAARSGARPEEALAPLGRLERAGYLRRCSRSGNPFGWRLTHRACTVLQQRK